MAFDYQRQAYFSSIGAVGFSYKDPVLLQAAEESFLIAPFERIKAAINSKIEKVLSYPQAAIAMALTTGERGAISEEDNEAMRGSGLFHLLSISGMHIGLVAGVLFFTSRLLMALFPAFTLKHPIKKYAAVIAFLGALFYTLLAGFSPPTTRSLIMTGFVLFAILMDRMPWSLRLVSIAAFFVLILTPESLIGVSFQMSFAAVTVLIAFYEGLRHQWSAIYAHAGILRRIMLYLLGIVITTILAEIAIAPFSLYHFQNHAVYGLIGNLGAIPLMSFVVMPFLVLGAVLMPLNLESLPLELAGWGITQIINIAHFTSSLDGAVLHIPYFDRQGFILFVFVGIIACLMKGWLRLLFLPFLFIAFIVSIRTVHPDIFISSKADLMAFKMPDGRLSFSNKSKDKYAKETWMRMNGQEGEEIISWNGESGTPHCDYAGCRGEVKGKKVAIASSPQAWQEDCLWAEILISSIPVDKKRCISPVIIDRFSVAKNGAHAVYINSKSIDIETVSNVRGDRLWTQSHVR